MGNKIGNIKNMQGVHFGKGDIKENTFNQNNDGINEIELLKTAQELSKVQSSPKVPPIKILFLTASPPDAPPLRVDIEMQAVDKALREAEYRDYFELDFQPAARVSDIQNHLLRYKPDIVHFSGHGSKFGALYFENQSGKSQAVRDNRWFFRFGRQEKLKPLDASTLSNTFKIFKDTVKCVVLNACYSEMQAPAIAKHIPCVVGMSKSVGDNAAIIFAKAFYRGLGYGENVETAFELGTNQLDLSKLKDKDTPKMLGNYDFSTRLKKVED